jgi:hypothetical protein
MVHVASKNQLKLFYSYLLFLVTAICVRKKKQIEKKMLLRWKRPIEKYVTAENPHRKIPIHNELLVMMCWGLEMKLRNETKSCFHLYFNTSPSWRNVAFRYIEKKGIYKLRPRWSVDKIKLLGSQLAYAFESFLESSKKAQEGKQYGHH